MFGCTQREEPVQNVGKVETGEGRLLTSLIFYIVLKHEPAISIVHLDWQGAILEDVEYLFYMKKAKAMKSELMSERRVFILNRREESAATAGFLI